MMLTTTTDGNVNKVCVNADGTDFIKENVDIAPKITTTRDGNAKDACNDDNDSTHRHDSDSKQQIANDLHYLDVDVKIRQSDCNNSNGAPDGDRN